MTRRPEFDDLVEGIESAEERERLLRVHELLVAAGPPPELTADLAVAPVTPVAEEEPEADSSWLPPRRLGAALLVGAGLVAASFGAGYIAGGGEDSPARPTAAPAPAERVVSLRPPDQNDTAGASIRLGRKGADGNWDMTITVRGLEHLSAGDYYALVLTKNGKPVVTCGTFNVAPAGATTVRMVAAYDLAGFDGWAITRYDSRGHSSRVVMRQT